ncbi:MAG: thymidine kinase [Alphaproteobacteria bacterium]
MQEASIEAVVGPMFAGKTTTLISRAEKYSNEAIVFKPSFDTRYALTDIKSHNGKVFQAVSASSVQDLSVPENIKTVIIDEVQFFTEPYFKGNIINAIMDLKRRGITVICAGLDKNWQGQDFDITSKVINIADRITILKAKCAVCGEPAGYSFKKSGSDAEIELGAADIYEPRCHKHFYNFTQYVGDLRCIDAKKLFSNNALLESIFGLPPANENNHLDNA